MKRHPFDPFSFFFGMIFAVVGIGFLTGRIDLAHTALSSLWPLPVVGLGLLLLIVAVRRGTEPSAARPDARDTHEAVEPEPEPEPSTNPEGAIDA